MCRERIAGDDKLQERMLLALLTSISRDHRNEFWETIASRLGGRTAEYATTQQRWHYVNRALQT
jgi:ribosomal protein L18E